MQQKKKTFSGFNRSVQFLERKKTSLTWNVNVTWTDVGLTIAINQTKSHHRFFTFNTKAQLKNVNHALYKRFSNSKLNVG